MDATSHPEHFQKERQKNKRGVNAENKRATEAADERAAAAAGGKYHTTAALSPPLSKLGKLLHRPSMPSASPRSLTLSCTAS